MCDGHSEPPRADMPSCTASDQAKGRQEQITQFGSTGDGAQQAAGDNRSNANNSFAVLNNGSSLPHYPLWLKLATPGGVGWIAGQGRQDQGVVGRAGQANSIALKSGNSEVRAETDRPSGRRHSTLMRFLSLLNSSTARISKLICLPCTSTTTCRSKHTSPHNTCRAGIHLRPCMFLSRANRHLTAPAAELSRPQSRACDMQSTTGPHLCI